MINLFLFRIVSSFQALMACTVGVTTVFSVHDIIHDRFWLIEYYCWFGLAYFFYDIWAMYRSYRYEHKQLQDEVSLLRMFLHSKTSVVIHHIAIPCIGFPIVVYIRRGLGDYFLALFFLFELSTPFLSSVSVLQILKMQTSKLYTVNGILLLVTFFCCRVLMIPIMYWSYARYKNISWLWQVPLSIPMKCNIGCTVILLFQLFWLNQILRTITSNIPVKSIGEYLVGRGNYNFIVRILLSIVVDTTINSGSLCMLHQSLTNYQFSHCRRNKLASMAYAE
ncbi:uncharacterized protein TRIADDRAFT_32398 [Trichoplax adhaerens]|uniref:TLC domain-containing protein n=1 Tax=Trichoplax adhaerens TaxID=10228 RepID=B3SAN4_TRIAD|nr:hypothetical protein TRIADDRAFT_32398 [Trichoplax adhaerens]EDV20133.1 hypothetical protein TRIADDRAFT_32398 [Trichoplax adhaerens]|eukprot:XP_002117294.1 hypothetical protein TRIADDRAFT_32398 [Trichoplax adhaerens]